LAFVDVGEGRPPQGSDGGQPRPDLNRASTRGREGPDHTKNVIVSNRLPERDFGHRAGSLPLRHPRRAPAAQLFAVTKLWHSLCLLSSQFIFNANR
jgi:hypothetical protein